jgi:hypothetical protein
LEFSLKKEKQNIKKNKKQRIGNRKHLNERTIECFNCRSAHRNRTSESDKQETENKKHKTQKEGAK